MRAAVRRIVVVVAAVGLMGAVPATANAQEGFIADLYGGVGFPGANATTFLKPGFSAGVGVGYLFARQIAIRADFAGNWLKGEETSIGEITFGGDDITLYHYDASVMLNLGSPGSSLLFTLDLGAGATTISPKGDRDSSTRFTIPFGAALGYMVSENFGLFIKGRWYLIFTTKEDFGGSTWSAIPVWAGIAIRP